MFKMRNATGNAILIAKSERRRKELISLGFTDVEKKVETDLDKMKTSELEAFAEKNGIDLSGCGNKAEKLEKIKNSIKE